MDSPEDNLFNAAAQPFNFLIPNLENENQEWKCQGLHLGQHICEAHVLPQSYSHSSKTSFCSPTSHGEYRPLFIIILEGELLLFF